MRHMALWARYYIVLFTEQFVQPTEPVDEPPGFQFKKLDMVQDCLRP